MNTAGIADATVTNKSLYGDWIVVKWNPRNPRPSKSVKNNKDSKGKAIIGNYDRRDLSHAHKATSEDKGKSKKFSSTKGAPPSGKNISKNAFLNIKKKKDRGRILKAPHVILLRTTQRACPTRGVNFSPEDFNL